MPLIKFSAPALKIVLLVSALSLGASQSRADSPFDSMRGSWTGGGTVTLSSGAQEHIRCGASYQPSGPSLRLALRCASDSYKVDLTSQITSNGGQLSGTWSEASHQLQGDVTGSATPGNLQASAKSATFEASVNVKTTGGNQSISIRAPGTAISNVAIALRR
jgi:hypothetical protein